MTRLLLALALLCAGCEGTPRKPVLVGAADHSATDGPVGQAYMVGRGVTSTPGEIVFTEARAIRALDGFGNVRTIAMGHYGDLTCIRADDFGNLVFADGKAVRRILKDGREEAVTTLPSSPYDLTLDSAGKVYVSAGDAVSVVEQGGGLRAIKRMAGWRAPSAIVAAPDGTLVTSEFRQGDAPNLRVLRMTLDGQVTTLAGGLYPRGIDAVDALAIGDLGVVYAASDGAIKRIAPDGKVTIAHKAPARREDHLVDLVMDPRGECYGVSRAGRLHQVIIGGPPPKPLGAEPPIVDGPAGKAIFDAIGDLEWLDAETLAVADRGYRTVTTQGDVKTVLRGDDLKGGVGDVPGDWTMLRIGVGPQGQVALLNGGVLATLAPGNQLATVATGLGTEDVAGVGRGVWRLTPPGDPAGARDLAADGTSTPVPAVAALDVASAPDGARFGLVKQAEKNTVVAFEAGGPKALFATEDAIRSNLAADGRGRVGVVVWDLKPTLLIFENGQLRSVPLPDGFPVANDERTILALGEELAAIATRTRIQLLPLN